MNSKDKSPDRLKEIIDDKKKKEKNRKKKERKKKKKTKKKRKEQQTKERREMRPVAPRAVIFAKYTVTSAERFRWFGA